MKNLIASLISNLLLSIVIAYFLGKKRKIGFGWSLFFGIFLTVIGGFIITMLSPKYDSSITPASKAKQNWGWFLIIFFSIAGIIDIYQLVNNHVKQNFVFLPPIGLIGLGYYLLQLGKGKVFNQKEKIGASNSYNENAGIKSEKILPLTNDENLSTAKFKEDIAYNIIMMILFAAFLSCAACLIVSVITDSDTAINFAFIITFIGSMLYLSASEMNTKNPL